MDGAYFISYSREDAGFVQKLDADLRRAGIATWRDEQRLQPGRMWHDGLANAIEACQAIIAVISPASVASQWVKQELSFANRQGKSFIPVMYEATDLPPDIDFILGGYQGLDFGAAGYRENLDSLVSALEIDTPDRLREAARRDPAVYPPVSAEDVVEFLQKTPRGILWRVAALDGIGFWKRVLVVIGLRPWSALSYWLTMTVLLAVATVVMVSADGGSPAQAGVGIWALLVLVSAGIAVIPTAIIAAYLGWVRRLVRRHLLRQYSEFPHRSLKSTANPLLQHLDRIMPVIDGLLEQPVDTWDDYVQTRCVDTELSLRVHETMFVLTGLSFRLGI